jgi:predicted transcriptional regulator
MSKILEQAAEALEAGKEPLIITTRSLLWEFGAQRRSYYNVLKVRSALKKHGLATRPHFEGAYIDSSLKLIKAEKPATQTVPKKISDITPNNDIEPVSDDPTYRISKLAAANQNVVSVKPDATLEHVVTVMMERDFSQVPVMTNERDVKGVISWRAIGSRLALVQKKAFARDYMEPAYEVRHSDSMFDLIQNIVQRDYVLVRGEESKITGIITGSDLSVQFQQISEPFLLLSEVENLLRMIIEGRFDKSDLQSCRDEGDKDRVIDTVADLTFGEYIRLLENESRWKKFDVSIDRVTFCKGLDDVRRIRNDVMHFDPDGVAPEDLDRLRDYTKFLRRLHLLLTN